MEQARPTARKDSTVDTEHHNGVGGGRATASASSQENEAVQMNENEFERTAIRCFRYFIIVLMLSATIAAGLASYNYLHGEEGRDFSKEVCSIYLRYWCTWNVDWIGCLPQAWMNCFGIGRILRSCCFGF